jgi:hypothetical protein
MPFFTQMICKISLKKCLYFFLLFFNQTFIVFPLTEKQGYSFYEISINQHLINKTIYV